MTLIACARNEDYQSFRRSVDRLLTESAREMLAELSTEILRKYLNHSLSHASKATRERSPDRVPDATRVIKRRRAGVVSANKQLSARTGIRVEDAENDNWDGSLISELSSERLRKYLKQSLTSSSKAKRVRSSDDIADATRTIKRRRAGIANANKHLATYGGIRMEEIDDENDDEMMSESRAFLNDLLANATSAGVEFGTHPYNKYRPHTRAYATSVDDANFEKLKTHLDKTYKKGAATGVPGADSFQSYYHQGKRFVLQGRNKEVAGGGGNLWVANEDVTKGDSRIDELSTPTLAGYIKGAKQKYGNAKLADGFVRRETYKMDGNKKKIGPIQTARINAIRAHFGRKSDNASVGIDRATDRLAKRAAEMHLNANNTQ